MKDLRKFITFTALMAVIATGFIALSLTGCNNGTTSGTTPIVPITITLTPNSVTVNDGNLTPTVSVGGTAKGSVTLNTTALPDEVTATVSGSTITVTGVRPTTDVHPIRGSFTVGVTRDGITVNLTVEVHITTTWVMPEEGALRVVFSEFGDEAINYEDDIETYVRLGDPFTVVVEGVYDRYYWYFNGELMNSIITSDSYVIYPWDYDYVPGIYHLLVIVEKDGIPYSKELTVRVQK